jgi:hypothetical protein
VATGDCELTAEQPVPVPDAPQTYRWTLNSVSNEDIYALVFER